MTISADTAHSSHKILQKLSSAPQLAVTTSIEPSTENIAENHATPKSGRPTRNSQVGRKPLADIPKKRIKAHPGNKFGRTSSQGTHGIIINSQLSPKSSRRLKKAVATAVEQHKTRKDTLTTLERDSDGQLRSPRGGRYHKTISLGPIDIAEKMPAIDTVNPAGATAFSYADMILPLLKAKKETTVSLPASLENIHLPQAVTPLNLIAAVQKLRQSIILTPDHLTKTYESTSRSQISLFNSQSPNVMAKTLGLPFPAGKKKAYEYAHLIAYRFLGLAAQKKENLVLATIECNTQMMFIEDAINDLLLEGHQVHLNVTATISNRSELAQEYHLAEKITYTISVPGLIDKLKFVFDAQSQIQPHEDLKIAIKACIDAAKINHGSSAKHQAEEMLLKMNAACHLDSMIKLPDMTLMVPQVSIPCMS